MIAFDRHSRRQRRREEVRWKWSGSGRERAARRRGRRRRLCGTVSAQPGGRLRRRLQSSFQSETVGAIGNQGITCQCAGPNEPNASLAPLWRTHELGRLWPVARERGAPRRPPRVLPRRSLLLVVMGTCGVLTPPPPEKSTIRLRFGFLLRRPPRRLPHPRE